VQVDAKPTEEPHREVGVRVDDRADLVSGIGGNDEPVPADHLEPRQTCKVERAVEPGGVRRRHGRQPYGGGPRRDG